MRLEKHDQHCKSIVDTLEEIANGYLIKCPNCGEWVSVECIEDEIGQTATCSECGHVDDADEFEFVTMWDYFADFLDARFITTYDLDYLGVRVTVAWGGPNIFVDTARGNVELYWWNETGEWPIRTDAINAIDEFFGELYESKRYGY
jgi:predicted RNA-binding Zn-ribbon protein involved in translation (DUF1610 family)